MANQQNQTTGSPFGNPFGNISSILVLLLVFAALFFLVKGVFAILFWVSPVLLLLTLFIDYTVVTGFGKWIYNLVSKNWLNAFYIVGILVALSFLGLNAFTGVLLPAVASFLFGKALLKKKVKSVKEDFDNRRNGEYVEYEEVETEVKSGVEDIEFEEIEEMELEDLDEIIPPKTKQKEIRGNEYEDLF